MRLPYGQRYNRKSDRLDAPSSKGIGFRGPLSQGDHIVSEYSSDRDIQYPSVYEGISPEDTAAVLMAERLGRAPPRDVDDRAYEAARRRMDRGQSPFFEQGKDKYPAWSPDQQWEKPAIMPEREEPLMYSTGGAMKLNLAVDDALRVAKGIKSRKDKYNSETRKEGGSLKIDPNAEAMKLIAEINNALPSRNETEEFANAIKSTRRYEDGLIYTAGGYLLFIGAAASLFFGIPVAAGGTGAAGTASLVKGSKMRTYKGPFVHPDEFQLGKKEQIPDSFRQNLITYLKKVIR